MADLEGVWIPLIDHHPSTRLRLAGVPVPDRLSSQLAACCQLVNLARMNHAALIELFNLFQDLGKLPRQRGNLTRRFGSFDP